MGEIKKDFNIKMADIFVLKDMGVVTVEADYSGSGDSGSIDTINYNDKDGCNISDIPNTIFENIEEAFYEQLNETEDWYNNEGGYGTIVFDLEELAINISQSIRIVNTEDYEFTNVVNITENGTSI